MAVEEALAHAYLANLHDVADEPVCPEVFSFDFEQQLLEEEQIKDMIYKEALALNPEYAWSKKHKVFEIQRKQQVFQIFHGKVHSSEIFTRRKESSWVTTY